MSRLSSWLAGLALITACNRPADLSRVSAQEAIAHQRAWSGKTLWIDGWVNGCGGEACLLFVSRAEALAKRGTSRADTPEYLGIVNDALDARASETWDARIDHLGLRHVMLKARVDAECVAHLCTDRAPDLHALDIRAIGISPPPARRTPA